MQVQKPVCSAIPDVGSPPPLIHYIPLFFDQADFGFFSYKNKKYGIFFCAVQTFTRRVFALAIRNTKSDTLVKAIGSMLKVLGYKKSGA